MENEKTVFLNHLEFLGCKIEPQESDDENEVTTYFIEHPRHRFWINFGRAGLFHRCYIELSKLPKSRTKLYEMFNEYNKDRSRISFSFLSEKLVCVCVFFNGEYSKITYGSFMENYSYDIDEMWAVLKENNL